MSVLLYSLLFLIIIYSTRCCLNENNEIFYKSLHFDSFRVKPFCIFSILCYVYIRAISYDTGADYLAYYHYYISCVKGLYDEWGESREIGFQILINILSSFSESPNCFFAICAIISMGSVIYVSKFFGRAAPYIIFAWALYMFNLSMNLYRQYIALSILLLVYGLLTNKTTFRMILSVCLVVLAFTFHRSSVVGVFVLILIYSFRNKIVNKWVFIMSCIISTIATYSILGNFFSIVGTYSDAYMALNERSYAAGEMLDSMYDKGRLLYVNLVFDIIVIWYGDRVMKYDCNLRYLYYVLAICLIITPLTQQEILMRMRLYLSNIMIVGYGLILYLNKRWFSIKSNLFLYCAVAYHFLYLFVYQNTLLFQSFPIEFK